MEANQDELQAAIDSITGTGSAATSPTAASDAISQIENTIGAAAQESVATQIPTTPAAAQASAASTMATAPIAPASATALNESITPAASAMIDEAVAAVAPTAVDEMITPAPSVEPKAPSSLAEIIPQKAMYGDPDLDRVKINALNELRPILETVDMPAEKKFTIYKDIIDLTDDKACIEPAYNAAKQITIDKIRAEALLFIIETIDSLGVKVPKA